MRGFLFIISSLFFSPAGAQLTLEQAIRLAQDSTIAAFESRYEQEYHTQHYDEFMALRKPQLNLRVAPNYYKYIADLTSDYVDIDNYHNLSAAASATLTQKMLDWGGEAYVGTRAIWSEYFGSDKLYARRFVAAPLMLGYRQTLLGYNPYRWEKAIEDQRLKAAQQQHDYDMNQIAEETARRALSEEVTTTLQDVSTYYLLLERTHKAVTDADEVYELIADNYANGLCDINTFALAEKRRNSAYQHYLRSLEKYWTTYYHLKTLMGG